MRFDVSVSKSSFSDGFIGNAYDEFIKQRPNREALGDLWYEFLDDASKSFIMSMSKRYKYNLTEDKAISLIRAANRYARLYAISIEKERVLRMFKSVVFDITTDYGLYTPSADNEEMFNGLAALFNV